MKKKIVIESLDQLDEIMRWVREAFETGKLHELSLSPCKPGIRTLQQNKALHLWLTNMSVAMTDAGFTHRKLWESMKGSFDIPVTMEMLKDIAQNISFDMFKKKHTSELTTIEMQGLYETLNSAYGQCVGVSLPWPSNDPPAHKGAR